MSYDVPPFLQPTAGNCSYLSTKEGQFLKIPEDKVQVEGAIGIEKLSNLFIEALPRLRERHAFSSAEITATGNALNQCKTILSDSIMRGLVIHIKEPISNFAFEIFDATPKEEREAKLQLFNSICEEALYQPVTMQRIKTALDIKEETLPAYAPDSQFIYMPPNFTDYLKYEVNDGRVGFFMQKDEIKFPIPMQALLFMSNLIVTTFPQAKVISPEEIVTQLLVDLVNSPKKEQ